MTAAPAGGVRVGVLVSGRGSNMEALAGAAGRGELGASIALVVSNVASAPAVERARALGLRAVVIESRGRAREEHDAAISAALEEAGVGLACLAGYMRILSAPFVDRWAGRLLNVHPSLLPSFPGLDAQRQALEHGVKVSGATVHFVDGGLDSGPIVAQEAVPVLPGDDVAELSARILAVEHRLYPRAVHDVATGRVRVEGRRVVVTT